MRTLSSTIKAILLLLCFLAATPAQAISWEEIKASPAYIYGEGWGASDREADKNALADLISKISVAVVSEFDMTEDERLSNGQVDSQRYASQKVSTYSQTTLNNANKITIEYEPDAHVGRYIRRSEIERLFAAREARVTDMVQQAIRGETAGKIDDALRYYYWALSMLKTLQRPNEVKFTDENGNSRLLVTWIPEQMNRIFDDLDISVTKTDKSFVEIQVMFRGKPVSSFDYTYFDGQQWSNLYSAKDGKGVIELSPGALTDNIRIKCEYEYASEAHIDKEMETVLNVVRGTSLRKSYIHIDGSRRNLAAVPESNSAAAQYPERQQSGESHSAVAPAPLISPVPDDTEYRQAIAAVLSAIRTKRYAPIRQLFTENGADMFERLIRYGNARILDDSSYRFYRKGDEVVCRSVPMAFSFKRGVRKSFVEDVVFTFNSDKQIDCLAFGLGDSAEKDILGKAVWSEYARTALMEFLENYKTAYALKRLDYIRDIFDDNAVIIVGHVAKRAVGKRFDDMNTSFLSNQYVRYTKQGKDEYLSRLERCFRSNEFINIRFSNNDVVKTGKGGELYGIQIKQDYYSSTYGDTGYLFLMVDLNEPKNPVIKVRTWQPQKDPDFGLIDPTFF